MKPLVSVIIPVYRTEAYLEECVESATHQTYQNLEIILVDDGSPDGCPAMCDAYAQRDDRIKVIHQQNGGLSAARNAGKAIASGQYLTFLDSDDIWAPETVEHMVALAQKENAQVVKIGVIRKYTTDECVTVMTDYTVVTGKQALQRIFWDNSQIITICGKLFDAYLFQDLDFPTGIYYEDEYTTPRIYLQAERVVLSNSELYFYMQRENESIIRGALNEKRVNDSLFVTQDRIEFFQQEGLGSLVNKAVQDHYHKLCKLEKATQTNMEELHSKVLAMKHSFCRQHPFITGTVKLKLMLAQLKNRLCGKI